MRLPYAEFQFSSIAYLVRTAGGLADPATALHARVAAIDRNVAISRVLTLRDLSRRTHEMGIRMALGASAGEIRRIVLADSGRLVILGWWVAPWRRCS